MRRGGIASAVPDGYRASPAIRRVLWHSLRFQHRGGEKGSDIYLHRFVRDNRPSQPPSPPGGPKAESGGVSAPSWSHRVRMELLREEDTLGGMVHKDVYRDPSLGYAPQYAPRDFTSGGGSVHYHHPSLPSNSAEEMGESSAIHHAHAVADRGWRAHEASVWKSDAGEIRRAMRECSEGEVGLFFDAAGASSDHLYEKTAFAHEHPGVHPTALLHQETVDRLASKHYIPSRLNAPPPSFSGPLEPKSSLPLSLDRSRASALSLRETADAYGKQEADWRDDHMGEYLHQAKGGRARERFDFQILQRTSRLPFEGYDRDRFRAQGQGMRFGGARLSPLVPPSSLNEAQKSLREAAKLPTDMASASKIFLENTVVAEPQLGEDLTETVLQSIHRAESEAAAAKEKARAERFGLGRKGAPLVMDGGPDKRSWKRGENDERLLDAALFGSNAYRRSGLDEHTNPYIRGDTSLGVGHLLLNRFDVSRREEKLSEERKSALREVQTVEEESSQLRHHMERTIDYTERQMQHFGTPIAQQLDEFVFRHRNARGERPLAYYKPFPHFRDMRLYQVYDDVKGFNLLRSRPEFLEWELFSRYRAHHQQRRALALLHGLEPVANETADERDARRLRLDLLCEQTPFNPGPLEAEMRECVDAGAGVETEIGCLSPVVSAESLRSWFGVFLLPSPTVVAKVMGDGSVGGGSSSACPTLYTRHLPDSHGTPDTREHLLSSRYLNQLLLHEQYQFRLQRGSIRDVQGCSPEPVLRYGHRTVDELLRYFSTEERIMYFSYLTKEQERQRQHWQRLKKGRRWIPTNEGNEAGLPLSAELGSVIAEGEAVEVVDLYGSLDSTPVIHTVAVDAGIVPEDGLLCESSEAAATGMPTSSTLAPTGGSSEGANPPSPATASSSLVASASPVRIEGQEYYPDYSSKRSVTPLKVRLSPSGKEIMLTSDEWEKLPMEVGPSKLHNHALDFGTPPYYDYNRGNYVEVQDALWERATAEGTEGWSPATHADAIVSGLPVLARSVHCSVKPSNLPAHATSELEASSLSLLGEYERGMVVSYQHQPFFNPDPRTVTVQLTPSQEIREVKLEDIMIWQRRYHGPERTLGDRTQRYNPAGLRRYINVLDRSDASASPAATHFLEKYMGNEMKKQIAAAYRSTKQITEIDQWNAFDTRRADNFRPLSISHRRDYIRQGYVPRFTPWEWISIQEGDAPVLAHTVRQDNLGPSFHFSLQRFWRYKARPHGYLRHYEKEIRDWFQFVDGVTPWKQAQKIRSYWEVRDHHPMPQFNRPEVAMHRNSVNLLPSHLWETDKKTGKVKAVRDSVRDYRTTTPLPKWVQL